ncbi:MAG: rhodanese-like domain-containing protein [Bacteroidia bacterium]|nr:rhodanese-like domain-containing protein [Bacteroidia bacterium]
MNIREKISIILVGLGVILAMLPLTGNRSFTVNPQKLVTGAFDQTSYFTSDQVARFIATEDTSIQLIDLRSQKEFSKLNIPGSINIPYESFIDIAPGTLTGGDIKYILYSNGDIDANNAWVIAKGLKINNVYVMKGGLNEWFSTVMNSRFTGERISARENALFESRRKAGQIFTEINSLPDSLKRKYFEARHVAAKKLDGGCE